MVPRREPRVISLAWMLFAACMVALLLRAFFIWRFATDAGDTSLYQQLGYNWLYHHVYGMWISGQLVPVDIRMPGYPAFLAAIAFFFGRSDLAIMLCQAVLDVGTCLLAAALAAALAPPESRRRVAVVAAWLAATCPFLANYCAVPLTEIPAAFFATAALVCFAHALRGAESPQGNSAQGRLRASAWLAGGLCTGFATLLRPEMPLLAVAVAPVMLWRWRKVSDWPRGLLAAALVLAGMLAPIAPWAARNRVTLHETQFLAPKYAQLPFEYVPLGYFAWTKTWLVHFRDVYATVWTIEDTDLSIDQLPPSAFDSPAERARVAQLIDAYNDNGDDILPETDNGFGELARERTRRDPLRTYLWIPIERAFTIWFTPRIEFLPYSGQLRPLIASFQADPVDFSVTLGFGALNFIYVGLALAGFAFAWRRSSAMPDERYALATIAIFLVLRTAYLTTIEAPEPRYVVLCFPAVMALVAQAARWRSRGELRARGDQRSSSGSG